MVELHVKKTVKLSGTISAPPSKAHSHRAIIASSLANGKSQIFHPSKCVDVSATITACRMFGARIRHNTDERLSVKGAAKLKTPKTVVDCKGSGSTIRFLTPVFALAEGQAILTGDESLRHRPMQSLLDALTQLGVRCFSSKRNGTAPLVVFGGGIKGGRASLRGDVSSQFVSGLLFGCPKAETETTIELESRLESRPYAALTLEALEKHGIKVNFSQSYERFCIPNGQEYLPADHKVEGDYSSAAFVLAASAVTKSNTKVTNLPKRTLQGDSKIVEVLRAMGIHMDIDENSIEISGLPDGLSGMKMDLRDAPDLVPVCAVLACFAEGETILRGVSRLRLKESDRMSSLVSEIGKMGGEMVADGDRLTIVGKGKLHGARLSAHNDHRIAMACAVAGLGADGDTMIHGVECVKKSYVDFVKDLRLLGGKFYGG